jgi:hypothetical protein
VKATQRVSAEEHIRAVIGLSKQMLTDVVTALDRIKQINRTIHILSMNARVEAARAGDAGRGFAVVAQELTGLAQATEETARDVEQRTKAITAQVTTVADRLGADVTDDRMCDLAHNAIDVIDRNLYERSCDVRWWATDSAVVDCAAAPTTQTVQHATRRLGQILDSYTVYFDLVLASLDGRVLANGRPNAFAQSVGSDVSASAWFTSAKRTRDGTEFGFESVHASPLADGDRVLVYSCVVREGGVVKGRALGVLGIVFHWDALGPETLKRLPLSPAEWQRTRTVIVDDEGRVLADNDVARIGTRLAFDGRQALFATARGAVTVSLDGASWRICHSRSPGFETYATGWHSLILRRLG